MQPNLDIVYQFEQRHGKPAAWKRANEFMISYRTLAKSAFPEPTQKAIRLATRFRSHAVPQEGLEAARLDCWKFFHERSPHDDNNTPEVLP